MATNHVINHFGMGAVHLLQTMVDHSVSEIVESLLISESLLNIESLRNSIWQQVSDPGRALSLQLELQEYLVHFAEELLRLCPVDHLDQAWVERHSKGLAHFREHLSEDATTANAYGLQSEEAVQLAAMPELSHAACALHLSSTLNKTLARCLSASRVCLKLLPIRQMEAQLRSRDWGEPDAHSLRREWLHRLVMLKENAIRRLLDEHEAEFENTGRAIWHEHHLWETVEPYMNGSKKEGKPEQAGEQRRAESRRMQLLLALTRLESIIDNS